MIRSAFRALTTLAAVLGAAACQRAPDAGASADSTAAAVPAATAGAAGAATTTPHTIAYRGDFKAPLGVQLWSFREQAKGDPKTMFRLVHDMGFTHVETAGLYDMPAAELATALKDAGLQATSMHVSYDEMKKDPKTVIANAKALGATYVGVPWYPHDSTGFTEANARKAIADFNQFGKTLNAEGITFFYHNHGYEPVKYRDGTLYDLIIRETDPKLVSFELDVLWAWLPGVDPVAMIKKYPGRFKLMHIKDMKPGQPRGSLSGGIPDADKAAIGEGQVDWSALMAAAEKDGLKEYYIEDETTDPVRNAPRSIAFLEGLKFPAR